MRSILCSFSIYNLRSEHILECVLVLHGRGLDGRRLLVLVLERRGRRRLGLVALLAEQGHLET